jgi:CheY-like chemotaxis protein
MGTGGHDAGRQLAVRARRPGRRVLVVDDQEDNRRVLAELLSSDGLEVVSAANGREALELFERARPDLVFMDVKMPVMDGVEATARIREHPLGRDLPIILLSASVFEDERSSVLGTGATAFLAKPIREAEVWAALGHHLGPGLDAAPDEAAGQVRAPSRAEVTRLGSELVRALRAALELGDIDRASELLQGAEPEHPEVVAALRARLDAFDLDGLLDRL